MHEEDWDRREALLDALLDLPEAGRAAFIAGIAEHNPEDARALRDWVQGIERSEDYLAVAADKPAATSADTLVGNWRLLRLLGRGGMGEVWLGERADGLFSKQVAVKVIRDDRPQLARHLESERRVLAALQHPGIVRLLDAGSTAEGHPFLVTDFIDGVTLDVWLRERQPSLARRLALFTGLAQAVLHAHEHLVIHRDIKPGNVLVSADGSAHLLDFGIASALAQGQEDARGRAVALTPEFAAPELLGESSTSIRTDVYALGGLLYFLMCGQPPLALRGLSMAEMATHMREQVPLPPSARMEAGSTSADRSLLADLDAITLKALAKSPQARYASVTALLADLHAAQNHQLISARPPSWRDSLRRAWRRNRVLMASTGLIMTTLLAGMLGTLWQAREASVQRDRAAAEAARANEEAQTANKIRDFLIDVYRSADPIQAGRADGVVTARDLVDAGVRRIDAELAAHPVMQAQLFEAMGMTYSGIGENALAQHVMRRAHDLAQAHLGEASPVTTRITVSLAQVLTNGSDDLHGDEMIPLLERVTALQSGEIAPEVMVAALDQLGLMQQSLGKPAEGLRSLQRAVEVGRAASPAADAVLAEALSHLSLAYSRAGKTGEAIAAIRESLAISQKLQGLGSVAVATSQIHLAQLLVRIGGFAEANALMDAGVNTYRDIFGRTHHQYAWSLRRKALLYIQQGYDDEVEPMLLESLAISQQTQGEDSVDVSESLNALAALKMRQMRLDEAIAYQEKVVAFCLRVYGADSTNTLIVTRSLAGLHARNGETEKAEQALQQVLTQQQNQEGSDIAGTLYWLGNVRRLRDDADAAHHYHQQALQQAEASMGTHHDFVYRLHMALAEDLRNLGQLSAAREHAQKARDGFVALLQDESLMPVQDAAFVLAQINALDGRCEEALPALAAMQKKRAEFPDLPYARSLRAEADFHLARCRMGQEPDQEGEVAAQLKQAVAVLEALPQVDPHLRRMARAALTVSAFPTGY